MQSWLKKELWAVRNFHQGFHGGLWTGPVQCRTAIRHRRARPGRSDAQQAGYKEYENLHRDRTLVDQSTRFKGDGKLTFDRLTDVYHSGTRHDEDQPCHLIVLDPNICGDRCVREFGNPCQYFCPAAVYEMVTDKGDAETENQRRELRPLQDLRYRRSLPDYPLGPARRRRRAELRRNVTIRPELAP